MIVKVDLGKVNFFRYHKERKDYNGNKMRIAHFYFFTTSFT